MKRMIRLLSVFLVLFVSLSPASVLGEKGRQLSPSGVAWAGISKEKQSLPVPRVKSDDYSDPGHDCDGIGDGGPSCIYGYVYYGDVPVVGANVKVQSAINITGSTDLTGYGLWDPALPYYSIYMTETLEAIAGGTITVTATYSGFSRTVIYQVAKSVTRSVQVDIQFFRMLSPADGAFMSSPVTLQWEALPQAQWYEYCIDSAPDKACTGGWVRVDRTSQVTLELECGLYNWAVRGYDGVQVYYARPHTTSGESVRSFVINRIGSLYCGEYPWPQD